MTREAMTDDMILSIIPDVSLEELEFIPLDGVLRREIPGEKEADAPTFGSSI